jgi:tripartite-type tricarboxylate transporter receptor subunit TctC
MRHSFTGFAIFVAALSAAIAGQAQAKDYPNKPVRVVVPFPPGGVVDAIARVLVPKLSDGG